MTFRRFARSAAPLLPAVLGAWWIWALLVVPDHRLVLDRRVDLPPLGPGITADAFFIAAPIVVLSALAAIMALGPGRRGRRRAAVWGAAGAAFCAALIVNAVKCLKLHDPVLSYATAGMAVAGALLAAAGVFAAGRHTGSISEGASGRSSLRIVRMIAAAASIAAIGIGLVLILAFIPWSLFGDIPKRWNYYSFGPPLRSVLYADLEGYRFRSGEGNVRRSFRGIRLEGANLRDSEFRGVDFRGARMWRVRMERADFEGADLAGALFAEGKLSFVNFRNADLSGVRFGGAYCMGGDFRGAVLRGSNPFFLFYADGRGADFTEAKMAASQLFGSDLRGAVFRNADFTAASLIRARLDGADLTGAVLARADMDKAVLRGAVLDGADLSEALRLQSQ